MKVLNVIVRLFILCMLLQIGCKQITKSVNDTFKPSDTALKRQAQKQSTTGYTTITTQQIQKSEVIINGDTLNTEDLREETKALFKDLEKLQKNKKGNNSKEIQEKVNEFLKNINIPQKVGTAPQTKVVKHKRVFFSMAELKMLRWSFVDCRNMSVKKYWFINRSTLMMIVESG